MRTDVYTVTELDRQQQLLLQLKTSLRTSGLLIQELCVCGHPVVTRQQCLLLPEQKLGKTEPSTQAKPVKNTFLRMDLQSPYLSAGPPQKILEVGKRLERDRILHDRKARDNLCGGLQRALWGILAHNQVPQLETTFPVSMRENIEAEGDGQDLRLFHSFEELLLEAHGDYGLRNDYHMNLGQFLEFLQKTQSEHVFRYYLVLKAKVLTPRKLWKASMKGLHN